MAEEEKDHFNDPIDKRLDLSGHIRDNAEHKLVEDLEGIYQSYLDANVESLARVQANLEARLRRSQSAATILPLEPLQSRFERKYHMDDMRTIHSIPRRSRFMRAISAIAAVLVAAAIIGSTAFLLSSRNTTTTSPGNQISTPATNPSPTTSATPAASTCDIPDTTDTGLLAVCQDGLETKLHSSKTAGNIKITFVAGYADAQRIVLRFTIDGATNPASADPSEMWSISRLTMQGGFDLKGIGTGTRYDPQKKHVLAVAETSLAHVPAGTTTLHLSAQIKHNITVVATIDITTPIPITTAKRVATPHQQVTVGGQTVTLDHLLVTPSMTTLYLLNPYIVQMNGEGGKAPIGTLSGNGWSAKGFLSERRSSNCGLTVCPLIGAVLTLNNPLYNKQGEWTLQVQTFEGPAGKHIWTFKFTVPPDTNH